jgi:hypothetical protein
MTAKRNFKRRVRERQARMGERYTTARRRLLDEQSATVPGDAPAEAASGQVPVEPALDAASKAVASKGAPVEASSESVPMAATPDAVPPEGSSGDAPMAATPDAVPVIELLDVSDAAAGLGLRCRIRMFPALAELVDPGSVLTTLRDALVGTAGDPSTELLSSVALHGKRPPRLRRDLPDLGALQRFFRRARLGLGGVSEDGTMLVLHVAGRDKSVMVLCTLSPREPLLMLMGINGTELAVWDDLGVPRVPVVRVRSVSEAALFLIHEGRRYPVTTDELVIGSDGGTAGLAIGDAAGASGDAAVIRRHGTYYLKGLGSTRGIFYKGMCIDNKRIDEGDVFQIGEHELRFTYRVDG